MLWNRHLFVAATLHVNNKVQDDDSGTNNIDHFVHFSRNLLGVRPGPKGTMVFPLVNAQPEEGQYHQNDNAHTDANAHVLHLPTRERKNERSKLTEANSVIVA